MVQSDPFWPAFCRVVGIEHLQHDPLYENNLQREKNGKSLIAIISNIFLTKKLDEREKIFDENGLICGRVLSPTDVVNDKQASENGFFTEIDHPIAGLIKLIAGPADFSATPATIRTPAPRSVSTPKRFFWNWDIGGKTSLISKSRAL
ncbi:MAG: CoA transferase [Chloroflexi bacterium]|nr:CoA transferase [Chloroflexota bacterium]